MLDLFKNKFFHSFTIAAAILWAPPSFSATIAGVGDSIGLSPFWTYKTIETDHFRLTFPEELTASAQKSAHYLEEAHALLKGPLAWEPKFRTTVLILDNTDLANGLTSPIGRFGMVFVITPPENWFSTAYYDDWLKLLAIHEYTHFLNMDATRDFWKVLRYAFGDSLLPNALWPTWMLEGLAVYMETKYTGQGRGRSPFYEMVLRQSVKDGVLGDKEFITLDQVNGRIPYYPDGETPYLFGYQLMNQVESHHPGALTEMTKRSSWRIPYFINGNLENITGKDWYQHWDDFLDETRTRMLKQIATIESQPITQTETVISAGALHTEKKSTDVLGSALSPDGRFIAYTNSTTERRIGLYLYDREKKSTRKLNDKYLGVGHSFTPDSKCLLASEIHRSSNYYEWSDLTVTDLATENTHFITKNLRARDPMISPDGSKVTFTITERQSTMLAWATLEKDLKNPCDITVGAIQIIPAPAAMDRVATPVWSPDSTKIVYSFHRNGVIGEELHAYDPTSKEDQTLLKGLNYHRFPTFSASGDLYFISDRTGVDNLYRMKDWKNYPRSSTSSLEQVSNLISGAWFPHFDPGNSDQVLASHFTTRGWELAFFKKSAAIDSGKVTVEGSPAPKATEAEIKIAGESVTKGDYEVKDYSIFPSIWPRAWSPIPVLTIESEGLYLGGMVYGFDAVDRHSYLLGGAYETRTKKFDYYANYTNRSLGPSIGVTASERTSALGYVDSTYADYARKKEFELSAELPWQYTWSTLVPRMSFRTERESYYFRQEGSTEKYAESRYVPTVDGSLSFSKTESSKLAVGPESGVQAFAGARTYYNGPVITTKSVASVKQYYRITDHSVLSPTLRGSYASRRDHSYLSSNTVLRGRLNRIVEPLPSDGFDELYIRGYPKWTFISRSAVIAAFDYRFPIAQIFRGWGTNPIFFNQLYGFVFGEAAYLPATTSALKSLPSAGGGVRFNTTWFTHVPVIFSLEYHHGFRKPYNGGEIFFALNSGVFEF